MVIFPLCCVSIDKALNKDSEGATIITEENSPETADNTVSVFMISADKTVDMPLSDYLVGAVAAEMPASFHSEALKAQAVASYSYMLWLKENADNPDYDISSDPTKHQGYLRDEEMKEKWGNKYESYKKKIEDAVSAVYGEYLTYNSEVILALFHAISPGITQDSAEVWETALPYIKPQSAPGDALSPDFDSKVVITCEKIREAFDISDNVKDSELMDIFAMSDSTYVKAIPVADKTLTAREIASKLSLRSPYFTAEYNQSSYIFKVKGYGHGLGMSQYSADYMARQGSSYKEILMHFYADTELAVAGGSAKAPL
jgi:stage II sporulation protein D